MFCQSPATLQTLYETKGFSVQCSGSIPTGSLAWIQLFIEHFHGCTFIVPCRKPLTVHLLLNVYVKTDVTCFTYTGSPSDIQSYVSLVTLESTKEWLAAVDIWSLPCRAKIIKHWACMYLGNDRPVECLCNTNSVLL